MSGHSIPPDFLFAILAETPDRELLPFEKLYVALNSNVLAHQGYLILVYKACGCLDKLEQITRVRRNSRELGDLAWISPDISHPLGRKPSSPFEANEFQRILRRFYDYSLDRSLDRLKGLG